ncbi:hypothetical protein PHLGIDRAFT_130201 [Phlebiopsis gigantea 11061_1 CR5-6]|uniref:Uncharacterized protein n=1 Tax=Phlebiopsis gigantea (strain 11061_1 CR5-6) TaxID=745531 RepID=A0A0C3S571_PHLG1|nr:hypothetical protein PHLGIDRAFT_130201 [Phlebiopsis gigantea 11061_1 CR5-6]
MTTSHVEWRYDSPAAPIFDHPGAQAYVSEMKYLWRQEQWRLRQIYIRKDDNERFLAAFAVLSQLAYIVDAKLHHIFTLLSKDLFDELIKIIGLTEMQRERLHVGSSSTPAYIMTLDDIKLLTPILRGAEKMVASTTCWPISDDIALVERSASHFKFYATSVAFVVKALIHTQ